MKSKYGTLFLSSVNFVLSLQEPSKETQFVLPMNVDQIRVLMHLECVPIQVDKYNRLKITMIHLSNPTLHLTLSHMSNPTSSHMSNPTSSHMSNPTSSLSFSPTLILMQSSILRLGNRRLNGNQIIKDQTVMLSKLLHLEEDAKFVHPILEHSKMVPFVPRMNVD